MRWGFKEPEWLQPAWGRGTSLGSSRGRQTECRAGTPRSWVFLFLFWPRDSGHMSLNLLLQGRFYDSIRKVGKLRFRECKETNYVKVLEQRFRAYCHPTHILLLDIMSANLV